MRVAVVGHVEWLTFVRVKELPRAGEIVHALRAWEEPGGGGAVAAAEMLRIAGSVELFCALADDPLGRRARDQLEQLGVKVHASWRTREQRRALTLIDDRGERTITIVGERQVPHATDPLPWPELERCDAVYLTGGDVGAVRAARAARTLVATVRASDALASAGIALDALVRSANDAGETYRRGELKPEPRMVVATDGRNGGNWRRADGVRGSFEAASPAGPVVDSYGCGDRFAAGLTVGLASEPTLDAALRIGALSGAFGLSVRGALGG